MYVKNYYTLLKQGKLSLSNLGTETQGGCDFIEDAFEETFSSPVLNTTRWLPDSMQGQDHCTGLPPAGTTTCTQMCVPRTLLAADSSCGKRPPGATPPPRAHACG